MASKVKDRNSLYETDFFAWTQEQAQLLRERKFDDIDLENLAEEVETVGRSDKHQIESAKKSGIEVYNLLHDQELVKKRLIDAVFQ